MDRCALFAKKETTYGTDPTVAAANTLWAEDVNFRLVGQRVTPNPAKPGVGPVADHVYGQHVELGFKVPLIGSGTAGLAPKWGPLMKACGWIENIVAETSVTYSLAPDPGAADSMCLVWQDGNRRNHKVLGWRGRVGLELSAGQRPMLVISGRGLHTVVATLGAALGHAAVDFSGWNDPKPVASGTTTFEFDEVTGLGLRQLTLDPSDNVKFVDLPEQENVELRGARAFQGQCKITNPLPSAINFETLWTGGEVVEWAMVHGATAGLISTVLGRSQVLDPSYAREDVHDVMAAGLKCVASALTTDDDVAIVLT